MKKADKPAIEKIIATMVAENENVLNVQMAEAVHAQLGITVSRADISRLRVGMNLSSREISARGTVRRFRAEMERVNGELEGARAFGTPELALAKIVTLEWEQEQLVETVSRLTEKLDRLNRARQRKAATQPSA